MERRRFLGAAAFVAATASLTNSQLAGPASAAPIGPTSTARPVSGRKTSALLEQIQKAHGGLRRWRDARIIEANVAYGGPFWAFKGVADFVGTDHVMADVHRQRIRLTQPSGRVIAFDKHSDVLTVTEPHGAVERLKRPRASFDGLTAQSRWSVAQAGYFRAYATWLYLVEAFVFTYPGVEVTEIEPWTENGETWRVLSVTFPKTIDTHSTTQLYYFDSDAFMVRQDYAPTINGSLPTAHYQPERATVDGAVITSKHEIFSRNGDRTPDRSVVRISVDVTDISLY
ncbi:hypothetical protein [Streptomyces sp. HGB0020]|jgi:hypothetical protein|uniref:hypothetical protein n=1 Tax=Streptomyces sp. HGB0020 TaxID=1078086 RepID=UPI00034E75E1|nr:hypothetical protein [Streptomyces sp. HGB0020]EPD69461.1 hypothetical protein HMPREF1211_00007 [Streptomyces sp. HGB0020]